MSGEEVGYYSAGSYTEEQINRKVAYVVETIKDNKFVFVGTVEITMKEVYDAMDATHDIAHNMPSKFARRSAEQKYPEANPLIVMTKEAWEEKYGKVENYKAGDVVK